MPDSASANIWSLLHFRIAEILIGLMLVIRGTFFFVINFIEVSQKTHTFLDSAIILILLIFFTAPAFIGIILIDAGAFAGNPIIIIRNNLQKLFDKEIVIRDEEDNSMHGILFLVSLMIALVVSFGSCLINIASYGFYIKHEVSFGDLFTPLTIIISLFAIFLGWLKDQQQRRKEYEDQIRSAAGTVLGIMNRRELFHKMFFDNIQTLILDSVYMTLKEDDNDRARNYLWKGIINANRDISQEMLEEPIEEAFKDLYGYDPRLEKAFSSTLNSLREIEGLIFNVTLILYQKQIRRIQRDSITNDVKFFGHDEDNYSIEGIITDFREIASMLYYFQMYLAAYPTTFFKKILIKIINAKQDQIFYNNLDDLSLQPSTSSWKNARNCLAIFTMVKPGYFKEAVHLFDKALESCDNVRDDKGGLLAGKSLAYLGCGDYKNWEDTAQEARQIAYDKILKKYDNL